MTTHKELEGPGLLESAYEEVLFHVLQEKGLDVQRQMDVPLKYKNKELETDFRLDLLVEDKVIVECKATSEYKDLFESQVLTYLRLLDLKLGLVVNLGEKKVKDGIHRVVNGL